jgi:hypothetical protein
MSTATASPKTTSKESPPSTAIIWDIETGPLPVDQLLQVEPFTPPQRPGEFDPAAVKYGNATKAETRALKLAEAKSAHDLFAANYDDACESAKQDHITKLLDSAALSPITGRVLAIGLKRAGGSRVVVVDCSNEAEALANFWEQYQRCRKSGETMIGFNIFGFDLPFLIRRSWINNVDVPRTLLDKGRYWDSVFVDLMQVWSCGAYGKFEKLDTVARALGCGQKTEGVSGKDFAGLWESDRQRAIGYLENDVNMTEQVAMRLGVVI